VGLRTLGCTGLPCATGHTVSVNSQSSGLGSIVKTTIGGADAYVGGADPRREGVVLGDTFTPLP